MKDTKPTEPNDNINRLLFERGERLKELATLNQTSSIIKEGKPYEETLRKIAMILPSGWQYPEHTCARVSYDQIHVESAEFKETGWCQSQSFSTIDNKLGKIEVFYKKEFEEIDEGPFLREERDLIVNLSGMVSGYLNSLLGKVILEKTKDSNIPIPPLEGKKASEINSRKLLQQFLNKNNYDRDIYHDLMPFKVKEILLIANLYDAYSIEKEGRFSEHVLGEYHQLSLSSMPRITGVSTTEEAFELLYAKHFDLIIIMVGVDKVSPLTYSKVLKKEFPYIPIFLLLNNNSDISYFDTAARKLPSIDKIFIWNGESKVFFAMIKHVEDSINVNNDTQIGLIRVILLVEDSPIYYSRYLPMLYNIVLQQTKRIIDDVSTDELYKVLRMRARPKILLASNYEEAIDIFNRYRDFMLCLFTDVKFDHNGVQDPNAGFELAEFVRSKIKDLPMIIQSSDEENEEKAFQLNATFINKNSETLKQDFQSFITHYLGFGNFIYRDKDGRQIAVARSLKEFESHLKTIPNESLIYHAKKNHFSLWLMARGEIRVAKIINPAKVSDFENPNLLRDYLVEVIQHFRNEQKRGKIIPFEESAIEDESNIVSLSGGNLGGKGRGLAFVNTLIHNFDFSKHIPNINIRAPKTSVIGTDEFEYFLERNMFLEKIMGESDYEQIKRWFLAGRVSEGLLKKLKKLLRHITKPIAVRSSGLFEDSLNQPFAGIFETYLLPNNHPDINVRLKQAVDAIKLVYASVFSNTARDYIQAINYKIEEEKMAVIIQEVVGNQYGNYFYPHISGVAQSYNYYPFGHIKPEDGVANIAVGLGKYVVEGEKTHRFSPLFPELDNNSPKDQYLNSQVQFYAVDLKKENLNILEGDTAGLKRLDIDDAEMHGTLRHSASTYDNFNNIIKPGLDSPGPRVVNFANILKYNYIPLAKTIEVVLDVVKDALGSPTEIEFAVDLNKDANHKSSFYLLQIKPLIGNAQDYDIDLDAINLDKVVLYSQKGMGNGAVDDIYDAIFVDIDKFDKSKTELMVKEIETLNAKMVKQGKKYVLIGPGRWGTRDRWIGIPVTWPQISNAKLIVETSLENFPLDASSGSHFFHNVTSMNVGYCSIMHESRESILAWDVLKKQKLIEKTSFFMHVEFEKALSIKMDGRKRITLVSWEGNGE
ncbi:MAG: pyruvate, phosphate dikinase [Bacteroidales bacterium]|nr:pyruvate, phosphate dikinase [Bacteroidales bacterium]MCF8455144.1 pyruvate, phosphate dikinase [Bacteroidales bacterium]